MKYFLLQTNPIYLTSPNIINWYGKIETKNINMQNAYLLPKRELLFIQESANTIFTDIISKPFFLVSELIKEVILLYQTGTIWKEIILLDGKYEISKKYYLPIFKDVICLSEKSILNLDKSVIKKAVVKKEDLPEEAIFKVGGLKNTYIIARLDFVESILRRKAIGVGLVEVIVE